MKLIKVKNYSQLSKVASQLVIGEIRKKQKLVLGFATGKTPIGFYKNLVNAYKKKKVDFSDVVGFDLDEYYPIFKKNKKSYFYYMHKNLFDKVNIFDENINLLDGGAKNWRKECSHYEKKIKKAGGIDLQILGVGVNGHIGFNEPGSLRESRTRLVELTHVKGKGLTLGISTIMKSKKIILLASGEKKARAIERLIKGKEDKAWPVSFLRRHKNLTVIVDRGAGRLL
jgi:glucosamine-6-phosphate deaminase